MSFGRISWLLAGVFSLGVCAHAQLPVDVADAQADAIERLTGAQPGVKFIGKGAGLERVYGPPFGGGGTPEDAFHGFIAAYADLFAIGDTRLVYQGHQELSYGSFKTGTFKQYLGSYPVDRGMVTLLVRSQLGNPIVLAVNSAKPVKGPIGTPRISGPQAHTFLKKHHPSLKTFESPSLVVWMGEERAHLAWTFIASSPTSVAGCDTCGSLPERVEAFVDAQTGAILEERPAIWSLDVNGSVFGWASPGLLPDQANNPETLQPIHNLRVDISGGNAAFSNPNGTFTIANPGTAPVTVNAPLTGRWGIVANQAGTTMSLSQTVTPPGPADFIFNLVMDEFSTAQVNGLIHTNRVHDFAKAQNPSYPGIDIVLPINVNINNSCNAFFNGSSINFYRSQTGGGCPNTCYSTVVYHEYGHFIINRGGTNQGAYGEGMSDTIAALLADTPSLGMDFRGQGTGPLRSAINSQTYPTAQAIHTAGQIVSGAFWGTLQQLDGTVGHATGLALARLWAINSILLHPPGVTPGLTVDVLTLSDNDADITNGTPYYAEIAAGFGAKGLFAPPVEWVKITPVSPLPPALKVFNTWLRPMALLFEILPNGGVPDFATLKSFVRLNGGSWRPLDIGPKGIDRYLTLHKPVANGTVVDWYLEIADTQGRMTRYPINAPAQPLSYIVANGVETVTENLMDALTGWTVTNTSVTGGAWVAGNPNGSSLNGVAANPENDSSDSGVGCFFTGQGTSGGSAGSADLDGGPTTVTSPAFALGGSDAIIEYKRWFFNSNFDGDSLSVEVSTNGGASWNVLEVVQGIQNGWVQKSFRLGQFAPLGATLLVRFNATDNPNNSTTEAAVDHLVIKRIVL